MSKITQYTGELRDKVRRDVTFALVDGEWHTRHEIEMRTGYSRDEMRKAGLLEDGTVMGGQQGFKLTALATDAEIAEVFADLTSRAAEICKRRDAIANAAYPVHTVPAASLS